MFQFLFRFAFSANFLSFKPDTENTVMRILMWYQANAPTLTRCNFL